MLWMLYARLHALSRGHPCAPAWHDITTGVRRGKAFSPCPTHITQVMTSSYNPYNFSAEGMSKGTSQDGLHYKVQSEF